MNSLDQGFIAGYTCLNARADLLDRINVYPVADSDTGANLRISLGPLRLCEEDRTVVAAQLRRFATGNSGNIAAAFFSALLLAETVADLPRQAARGREQAWQAIAEPQPGTMLSVFDRLAEILAYEPEPLTRESCPVILETLRQAVLATTSALPDLQAAGVVDAGALGMYVFFDGFFRCVTGYQGARWPLAELFPGRLAIAADFSQVGSDSFCVDAIIRPTVGADLSTGTVAALGESVVVVADQEQVKVHIHTTDPEGLRHKLADLGELVQWSDESLRQESGQGRFAPDPLACLHIMTDAAGSLPRALARQYGITLLDSYIISDGTARPESLCAPAEIYSRMRGGAKVTTAQASLAERHELYSSICELHGRTLYLCVGSAFTGNYATAVAWKRQHDRAGLLQIVDTGAASGRLAVIALLAARRSRSSENADEVCSLVDSLVENCREYVFIDTLRYLVAGGRVSRTSAFFGDLLHMKPVISPAREGVRKVGVVRTREAQLSFALERLRDEALDRRTLLILLQYSDNRAWVADTVQPQIQALLPEAEILLVPLSLTSGVHMGPGTWSLAFAPVA